MLINYINHKDLILAEYDSKIILCDWLSKDDRKSTNQKLETLYSTSFSNNETAPLAKLKDQLDEYHAGERTSFNIETSQNGTELQKEVWEQLKLLPHGQTISYSDLAEKTSKPKAIRAVASAVGKNLISIVVPCHRVIRSSGDLGGYAGGLTNKEKLLKLERQS